jgi:hypothetical protein
MASEIKVNNIKRATGTTITLGESGDTISLACGASSTGFGAITWCSSVKTALFTAEAGKGYFINTCGGGYTVTLPGTASVGDQINFTDYARTWGTACKELTLNPNSLNFQGNTSPNPVYDTNGATVKIVYSGATQGWIPQLDKDVSLETPQSYSVQYLIVAGGGGGGGENCSTTSKGGGGAGGYRSVATKSFPVTGGASYTITVGAGGTGGPGCGPGGNPGSAGTSSIFSTITSAGGGFGSGNPGASNQAGSGGSGGGGTQGNAGIGAPLYGAGAGNIPCVSPSQGNPGGQCDQGPAAPAPKGTYQAGGGGGHTAAGTPGGQASPAGPGPGGAGTTNCISGSPTTYAGGGGAGAQLSNCTGDPGTGGAGGGGAGGSSPSPVGVAGDNNSGGGGGGSAGKGPATLGPSPGGAGGSGVVIIRRLTSVSGSTSGTVTTCGSDTIHTFTATGTFVA